MDKSILFISVQFIQDISFHFLVDDFAQESQETTELVITKITYHSSSFEFAALDHTSLLISYLTVMENWG